MEISKIILGLVLLIFGRKLFWLSIGIAGFLIGLELTHLIFVVETLWLQVLIALALGCLGALLAMLVQRLAFTLSGLIAGAFLALKASQVYGPFSHTIVLLLIVGFGIVGAVVATKTMNAAITILVCLVGAAAIVGGLSLEPTQRILIFLSLTGAGLLIQGRQLAARDNSLQER